MENELKNIRRLLKFFMVALIISGLTAIPVEAELEWVCSLFPLGSPTGAWLENVLQGVRDMNSTYPFLAYGYDWLAFAHFVLALVFIGPLKEPVRNKWVVEFGMMACLLIIPFALIAGHFRGIPFWWRLIDCSFGLVGLLPLAICYKKILKLESQQINNLYDGNSIGADR